MSHSSTDDLPVPAAKRSRTDKDGTGTAMDKKPNTNNMVGRLLAEKLAFWFSPANLRKDRFLAERMASNDGAWATVDDILTFQSVVALGASRVNVLDAARALLLPRLDVDPDTGGGRVRLAGGMAAFQAVVGGSEHQQRHPNGEDEDARTLYASPVPPHVTREQLLAALAHFSTTILYVSIPRHGDGRAKGFCFIEFDTAANATACALALDEKTLDGAARRYPCLRAIPRSAWRARKEDQKLLDKENARRRRTAIQQHGSLPVGDGSGCKSTMTKPPPSEQPEKEIPNFISGVILRCSDLAQPTSRRELHKLFEQYGPVSYVEYNQSDPMVCHVRFTDPTAAAHALQRSPPALNAALLTGENEQAYWDMLLANVDKSRARDKTRDRRRRKNNSTCHRRANSSEQVRGETRLDKGLPPCTSNGPQVARLHRIFKDDDEDDEG